MDRERFIRVAILAIEGEPGERDAARAILKKHKISIKDLLKDQPEPQPEPSIETKNHLSFEEILNQNIRNFINDFGGSFQKALINFLKK